MTACNAPRDASLFRTTPFAFWDASNVMLIRRLRAPERTHKRSVARMSDTYMRIAPTCILLDACKVNAKDTGDLLPLLDWIFKELGPPYMWIVMLSGVTAPS